MLMRCFSKKDDDHESTACKASAVDGSEPVKRGAITDDLVRKYVDKTPLVNILTKKGKPVRLVKPSCIIRQFEETADPLPCRQDLPEHAFLDVCALTKKELEDISVISISYCWLSKTHPDPCRYHLGTLAALLKIYMSGQVPKGSPWSIENMKKMGRDFGGHGRAVGVFLDWTGLYQDRPPFKLRTEKETELFKQALAGINAWYAHAETQVWKLTSMPRATKRATYEDSGWTFFEAVVGTIIKPSARVLEVDNSARAKLLGERLYLTPGSWFAMAERLGGNKEHIVPLVPEDFNAIVDDKIFTNGADRDAVVKPNYLKTFNAVIRDIDGVRLVDCQNLSGRDALKAIRIAAEHSQRLRKVFLVRCSSVELDLACLVEALSCCRGCAEGLRTLSLAGSPVKGRLADLAPLLGLQTLDLSLCEGVGGELSDLTPLHGLQTLDLSLCEGVGGELSSLIPLHGFQRLILRRCKGVSGELASLAPLVGLQTLVLNCCRGVSGELSSLAPLVGLQKLDLEGCTWVCGEVSDLLPLIELRTLFPAACVNVSGRARRDLPQLQLPGGMFETKPPSSHRWPPRSHR